MKKRKWVTTAVHRLTLLVYPSGDMSLSVQSRDVPMLAELTGRVFGERIETEGVYHRKDGRWVPRQSVWRRDEQAVVDAEPSASALITEKLRGSTCPVRSKDLVAACLAEGISRRTYYRSVARLRRMGVVHRQSAAYNGQCVHYSLT